MLKCSPNKVKFWPFFNAQIVLIKNLKVFMIFFQKEKQSKRKKPLKIPEVGD
jgi:hypothetical protein